MSGGVIEGVVYPDGWHYMQAWKGQMFRVDSDSYPNLLVAVEVWRVQNGCPVGNVPEEVRNQLCEKHPRNCHGAPRAAGAIDAPPSRAMAFIERITSWGRTMVNSPHAKGLVHQEVAAQRAALCARCPRNMKWEDSTCGRCVGAALQIFALARQTKELPAYKGKLRGCASYGMDCRTAVWMRKEALEETPGIDPWHECWMKK